MSKIVFCLRLTNEKIEIMTFHKCLHVCKSQEALIILRFYVMLFPFLKKTAPPGLCDFPRIHYFFERISRATHIFIRRLNFSLSLMYSHSLKSAPCSIVSAIHGLPLYGSFWRRYNSMETTTFNLIQLCLKDQRERIRMENFSFNLI